MNAGHGAFTTGAVLGVAFTAFFAEKTSFPQQSQGASSTQPSTQPTSQPAEPALYAGDSPQDWESYQALHAYMLDRFVRSDGFGWTRMPRIADLPREKRIYADGTHYVVGKMSLISLNEGKEPFNYVTAGDVLKDRIAKATHVPLDKWASRALDDIKKGKEVVLTGSGAGREMIGAVRASAGCVKCHEVPENTLLGAFRYPLVLERMGPTTQRSS